MPRIATTCPCCDSGDLNRQSAVLMPFVARRAFGWEPCEVMPEWGLRDLPPGHAHALCSTLHCKRCGLVFTDLRFDDDDMARLYAGYRGPQYEAERERFEPGYSARNRRLVAGDTHIPAVEGLLARWLPERPAILDWGGDTGLNTPLRRSARLHHVHDISGQPLVEGAQAVAGTDGGPYDLVVLSNVLEHVPAPLALLQQLLPAVGPATRLYVEVPFEALMQAGDADAWRRKRHWHEHINFFSEPSLHALLARAGLRVLELQQLPVPDAGAVVFSLVCARC